MRIYIEPHGCSLSYGEAELMQQLAEEIGFEQVANESEADVLVLHTCAVIESTERKMYTRIEKLKGLGKPFVVSGCLASIAGNKITELAPESVILPAQELEKFKNILETFTSANLMQAPKQRRKEISAVIPIATGCLGSCSFCITRIARGELRSKAVEYVLRQAHLALERGARELRLAAQDTACYGMDIGSSLPELVSKIAALEYEFRLRIGMMNVNTAIPILQKLISCYDSEKVYKFLHLPLQSGSQRILYKMARNYSIEDFMKIVAEFRRNFPNLTLSTDLIVGFPGETEEDHRTTVSLIKALKPDIVNIKAFSPRANTKAFNLKPRVNSKVVKARTKELSELRLRISKENFEKYVGSEQRILVTERGKHNTFVGRTSCYKPVVLKESVALGKFVHTKITKAESTYLLGELANFTTQAKI
ncbi:MAG: tRNA (N(6)-L-threonylcarbamoyladenosine(37)-C(2))-methylthiotransferase [Candidatus Thermoplasmatota archaeon]|nr:tRNA (N(6)-L-threonylcarbamoyladenosine(37)-C(2))-methylthiotransferase [Candidatus Thermoplasmatota archaeon]